MVPLRKVAIVGPESSGKTTLARELANHFGTSWVPEFARTYLMKLRRDYTQVDLTSIATGQLALEAAHAAQAHQLLICDTNLLVIEIWSRVAYGEVSAALRSMMDLSAYELYLLLKPDLPWEPDPLREHPAPEDRLTLFQRYESTLNEYQLPFSVIGGIGEERAQQAIAAIESRLIL